MLVPNLKAGSNEDSKARPDTAPRNPVREVTEPPPPTIADERELCAAPDCTVELADSQLDRGIQSTQVTVPLKGLGYLPPSSDREMSGFDYDTSIAYLGPTQFLFSFNPHILVPRSGSEANSFRKIRIVRAVLIDLETKGIVKTVDWRVPDSGRYLWPIGENQVLIHVGQELRVYGHGLQLRNQISLGGPLAFVRISPASEYFAVGIIHERHSPDIYRQLESRIPRAGRRRRNSIAQFAIHGADINHAFFAAPATSLAERRRGLHPEHWSKPLANRGEQLGRPAAGPRRRYVNVRAPGRKLAGELVVCGRL